MITRATPFVPPQGIVSGLVINGMQILDMTMNGDPRIKVYGDVRKVRGILGNKGGAGGPSQPAPTHRNSNKHRNKNQQEYVYNTGDFQRVTSCSRLLVYRVLRNLKIWVEISLAN